MKRRISLSLSIVLPVLAIIALVNFSARAEELKLKGLVEMRPASGDIGTWQVNGVSFEADAATTFKMHHGPLDVGACVEVEYREMSGTNMATSIESKEALDCQPGDHGEDDDYLQAYGLVESFPPGLIGTWVVSGTVYTVTVDTEFEQEHGSFEVGSCVEVKYWPDVMIVKEIETENAYKCDDTEPFMDIYGIVDSFPADLIGDWVVDGVTYTAGLDTQFEQEHGPFMVGGCVEIKYVGATNAVVEIETAKADKCSRDGKPGEQKFYGAIEVMPTPVTGTLTGTWTISGTDFLATVDTKFEQEHGEFAVGACVEVEYYVDNGVNIATEIETESAYRCNEGSYTNEAKGLVNSFPDALYGTWVISGTPYVASPGTTEFEEDAGSFAIGACVKVKYYTAGGVNMAVKIESEDQKDCTEGVEHFEEAKLYATIDSFPPDPFLGEWIIGGSVFSATAMTEFEQEHGPFAVDGCVEAKYWTLNGVNVLRKVETESSYKCMDGAGERATAYGMIELLPTTPGLTGTWTVSGVDYEVDGSTHLEEEHGFFVAGAYVEVKYTISNTLRLALKIETHVAPGAGRDTVIGTLDDHDGSDDWNDWVVDGVSYAADPAITVGVSGQMPAIGDTVYLNLYRQGGVSYVTLVGVARQTFLPLVSR